MVDAVVTVFLERLLKVFVQEGTVLLGYRDQFQKLQNDLQYMQSFFKDAERLKRKDEILKCTMADLRELVYEAEDILADCLLLSRGSQGKLLDDYSPKKIPAKYQMGKRLLEINEKITSIKEKISSYLGPLSQSVIGNMQEEEAPRWSSPVYDHTQVVGLEGDTRKLKDWLSQADNSGILSIGIVGMGGLGKTTVAQTVFNDKEVELRFEKRIWVSVSQKFTEEKIMRSILRNLGDANIGDDCCNLLKRINQFLLGKRFLIVLDDVWSKEPKWWLRIFEGLPKGSGSCIIVTTRNEEVATKMRVKEARIHRPKILSKDHSWLLFCNVAFAGNNGRCTLTELESIGKEIVSKCRGLPLAIKAVGGLMLCKPSYYHEWRRIADHFRDELAVNDNSVMASLQCSYDELPSYLKSCFLSLSIYPEDCEISKDQLVRWWLGEGFVPVRNGRLATEASEDCFSGLTNRCLVEVVEWDYNGKISICKVHDMVREQVIKIAEDDSFSGSSAGHCRHLGLTTDTKEKDTTASKKLRALVSTPKSGEVNKIATCVGYKFCDFRYLRVLDLSKSIFEVRLAALLCKIGCLKHLTCLNLNNTHPLTQVPQTLEKLRNLQILDLSYCQSLKSLPPFVMTFVNLVVLDVSHCGSLEFLPSGVRMLSNLQVLLGFKPARLESEGSRISELRSLSQLRILELQLTRADEIDDDETDALTGLKKMQILTLSCFNSFDSDKLISKLEKVWPPSQLHELSLNFYPGKVSPEWLKPSYLHMLRYLSLCGGNLRHLSESFWGNDETSWNIAGLKLDSLSHLSLQWEKIQRVMPNLEYVHGCWSPELISFPIEGVGFRGGVWKKEDRNG